MTWWAFGLAAHAGVVVEAPADCFGREDLALEVGAVVDDAVLVRLDLRVIVQDGQLSMSLRDRDGMLWSKVADVSESDCPLVPKLVARSVEQAVSELPAWTFAVGARAPEMSLSLMGAPLPLGATPRWELRGASSGPIAGRARWLAGVGVASEGLRAQGVIQANTLEVLARAGPAVDLGGGRSSIRLATLLCAGPALLLVTRDATRSSSQMLESRLAPAVRVEAEATWVGPGPLRMGVVGGMTAAQLVVNDSEGGVAEMPLARVGVFLGVAHVRSDGGRAQGP